MKYLTLFAILLLFVFTAKAQKQNYYQEIYGIKLKQFREVPDNEFGKPFKSDKYEDGVEYEIYLLKPDRSLYMVFEYATKPNDQIWSIQLSGTDSTADLGFQGVKFGTDKSKIEKQFGKPTKKVDVGEYGQRWEYEKSNFSFEINPQGKLSSIKIKDISDEIDGTPDFKKIPRFDDVLKTLTSKSNEEIAKLLAPDMEIYQGDKTFFFKKSLKNEIASDYSKIFALIKELGGVLKTVNTKNPDEYEENGRLTLGQAPKHVIKFKKEQKIQEIVFKYEWGQFVIWEIKAR